MLDPGYDMLKSEKSSLVLESFKKMSFRLF